MAVSLDDATAVVCDLSKDTILKICEDTTCAREIFFLNDQELRMIDSNAIFESDRNFHSGEILRQEKLHEINPGFDIEHYKIAGTKLAMVKKYKTHVELVITKACPLFYNSLATFNVDSRDRQVDPLKTVILFSRIMNAYNTKSIYYAHSWEEVAYFKTLDEKVQKKLKPHFRIKSKDSF